MTTDDTRIHAASEDFEANVLLLDRFDVDMPAGRVVGSRTTSGVLRLGADRERSLAIDHGQLRMGWLAHAGWGRSSIAYGPFEDPDGLVLHVLAMNGLTTSQTDARPEGRRAMLRRMRATFPRSTFRQPAIRDSMLIGWFTEPVPHRPPRPIAALVHRAGEDATGELWFQVGDHRTRVARSLQNLPARYAIELSGDRASLFAWSYPGATGFADPGDRMPVAEMRPAESLPKDVFAAIHQSVFGEVRYRVDSRVDEVCVMRSPTWRDVEALTRLKCWLPDSGTIEILDDFAGEPGDLQGSRTRVGDAEWKRYMGDGVIRRNGEGRAEVRASIAEPNPGRTAYCVPWHCEDGVEASVAVIPPGHDRGEGHQGRSGIVIWQDQDNHLVVNHFIDDGSVGVSISAFLRTGGREAMFEWDAVWSNVADHVQWGQAFELSVACDGKRFLCRVDGEPVLYRAFSDYRSDAAPLIITAAGLVANWEWGDDTGSKFEHFSLRPIKAAL